jgi:prevent-host-death family protein
VTKYVNIHEAKTHLSRLVDQVREDGEVVIARAGRPVARLVSYKKPSRRKLGALEGRGTIPDDFDAPLPEEELVAFEREADETVD